MLTTQQRYVIIKVHQDKKRGDNTRRKQLDNKNPSEINTNSINMYGNIYQNEFETIYHEVGHCFDFKSKTLIDIYTDRIKSQKDLNHLVLPRYHNKNTFEFVA